MAVTLDFAKVNSNLYTLGTLVGTGQVRAYKAVFGTALTSDTRAAGDDGEPGSIRGPITTGTLRLVANELNALVFESNGDGTTVGFVTEFHHVDIASLERRLEHLVDDGTASPPQVTVTEVGLKLA